MYGEFMKAFLTFLLFLFLSGASFAQTLCFINLNFANGSASPNTVPPGGTYTISCNYNSTNSVTQAFAGTSQCQYTGFIGNAPQFKCTAPKTPGVVTNSCVIVSGSWYCAQTNPINSVNVVAPAPAFSMTIMNPNLTCASPKVCNGVAACLSQCTNITGGVTLATTT